MLQSTSLMPETELSHKESLRPAWQDLDPALARALEPALPALVDEVIAAVEAAVPDYSSGVEENVRLGVRQALDGFVELVLTGSEAGLPERQIYVEFGAGEYRVGRTLDALLRAYRAGAQVAWRGLADAGDRADIDPRALYTLAEAIFAYIDEISAASAEGFAREQSQAVSELQARRHRLVDLLLREPAAEASAIESAATDAEWKLPDRLAVLAFAADAPGSLASRLPVGSLLGEMDGVSIAVIPDPEGPRRRGAVVKAMSETRSGLGHAVAFQHAPESARRARLALGLARDGFVDSGARLVDILLAGDAGLARDLSERALAPLAELPPNRRARLLETLEAWLDAHGDVRAASEALHVHTQTVRYRLNQLRELFGDALEDPAARLELALALRVTS
jgi:hypothetical protein